MSERARRFGLFFVVFAALAAMKCSYALGASGAGRDAVVDTGADTRAGSDATATQCGPGACPAGVAGASMTGAPLRNMLARIKERRDQRARGDRPGLFGRLTRGRCK